MPPDDQQVFARPPLAGGFTSGELERTEPCAVEPQPSADASPGGAGGARLEWELQVEVTKRWRGYLKGHPEITIFVLNLCADRDDRCHMLGAVMPDGAEREHTRVLVHWAKMAAEWYLADFIALLGGEGAEHPGTSAHSGSARETPIALPPANGALTSEGRKP